MKGKVKIYSVRDRIPENNQTVIAISVLEDNDKIYSSCYNTIIK